MSACCLCLTVGLAELQERSVSLWNVTEFNKRTTVRESFHSVSLCLRRSLPEGDPEPLQQDHEPQSVKPHRTEEEEQQVLIPNGQRSQTLKEQSPWDPQTQSHSWTDNWGGWAGPGSGPGAKGSKGPWTWASIWLQDKVDIRVLLHPRIHRNVRGKYSTLYCVTALNTSTTALYLYFFSMLLLLLIAVLLHTELYLYLSTSTLSSWFYVCVLTVCGCCCKGFWEM